MATNTEREDFTVLPIEKVTMPSEDVSDLRDVVDAINRLCATMKTSNYEETDERQALVEQEQGILEQEQEIVEQEQALVEQEQEIVVQQQGLVEPEEVFVHQVETFVAEKWSDSIVEDVSNTEQLVTVCEPISEYYTASSEVSLISDEMQVPIDDKDKVVNYASSEVSLQSDELAQLGNEDLEQRDDRISVMAGHVAAMRERFESMTRTNTPCPDLMRSASPSFDIFRNITPSPDQLDKS